MLATPRPTKSSMATALVAAVLTLACVASAFAQARGYSVEIASIDAPKRQVTFKASMGQQTMRAAPKVALDAFKPGDKVLLEFGQEGAEAVIVSIVVNKP
jgi:Cu/Ag efflux protein CusF